MDVAIVEVGLGGRLDATNCIQSPIVTGISSLGFDHMELLGHTLPVTPCMSGATEVYDKNAVLMPWAHAGDCRREGGHHEARGALLDRAATLGRNADPAGVPQCHKPLAQNDLCLKAY